jgi:hypothetical protein
MQVLVVAHTLRAVDSDRACVCVGIVALYTRNTRRLYRSVQGLGQGAGGCESSQRTQARVRKPATSDEYSIGNGVGG